MVNKFNNLILAIFAFSILSMTFSGCKTVVSTQSNGTLVTNTVVNSAAVIPVINSVVPIGVQVAINKDKKSVAYFNAAIVAIDTLVNAGVYDPAKLQSSLVALKADSQEAELAIQAGLSIYKSFVAEAVTSKLKETEYLAVLAALSDSLKQGLAFATSNTPGSAISVQIKVKN